MEIDSTEPCNCLMARAVRRENRPLTPEEIKHLRDACKHCPYGMTA